MKKNPVPIPKFFQKCVCKFILSMAHIPPGGRVGERSMNVAQGTNNKQPANKKTNQQLKQQTIKKQPTTNSKGAKDTK